MEYTIVIPAYNKESFIGAAIDSALAQTLPAASILVVDDASTDRTRAIAEARLRYRRAKILGMKQNSGISKVLNRALAEIDTPYFLQLDADDWLEPQAAQCLVSALHDRPDAAFAYGNHRLWIREENHRPVLFEEVVQPPFPSKYDFLLYLGYMLNPRCFRTQSVRQIGGYRTEDPWDGRYYDDVRTIVLLAERFAWVGVPRFLYNVNYGIDRSIFRIPIYNFFRQTFYEEMLERWGGEFTPVWAIGSTGRIVLKDLAATSHHRRADDEQ